MRYGGSGVIFGGLGSTGAESTDESVSSAVQVDLVGSAGLEVGDRREPTLSGPR